MSVPSEEHLPLYRQLADHYQQAVAQGALPPGARMPSVRELMQRHGVSLSTALQALRTLEEQGSVQARPRGGYFVQDHRVHLLDHSSEPDPRCPVQQIDGAQFAGINERISLWLEQGRRAQVRVDLGAAMPAPELFDHLSLNRVGAALLREFPEVLVQGNSRPGTHPLFQAAMASQALEVGVNLAPQDVMATLGN